MPRERRRWYLLLPAFVLFAGILFLFAGAGYATPEPSVWRIRLLTTIFATSIPLTGLALFMLAGLAFRNKKNTRRVLSICGILFAATLFVFMMYGFTRGNDKFLTKTFVVADKRIPAAFDDYRIALVSDFHIGTHYGDTALARKMVEVVNATKADLICFAGDAVNFSDLELEAFAPQLSRLRAKDGIVSIMGNHDYLMYNAWHNSREQEAHVRNLQQTERNLGWHLLLNEHLTIRRGQDSLVIVGVENDGRPPFPQFADLKKALAGTDNKAYRILLSHDPTHWRRAVVGKTDIPLTFSGHTHGMQFSIFGWSPSENIYPEWNGLYTEGQQRLYVTTGIGEVMIPFRLGIWPEVVVCTLRHVAY